MMNKGSAGNFPAADKSGYAGASTLTRTRLLAGIGCLISLTMTAAPVRAQTSPDADSSSELDAILGEPSSDSVPTANQPATLAAPEAAPAPVASDSSAAELSSPADTTAETTIPVTASSTETTTGESKPQARARNRVLEEIVVTAQKREENVQDVPISIQAFSAEALDAKGITNAVDLQLITPGLSYTVLNSFSIIYLRGVGTDAFLPSADLSVASYVDGIYFPSSAGLAQEFGQVERVEVLKGPQGTLFGRNSTGGAISVITKKPSQEFEASAETSYGRFNDLKTKAYVNLPLGDELAFSLSALYNLRDSYYTHLNRNLIQDNDIGGRAKLRWTPTDNLDITLAALVTRSKGSTSSLDIQVNPKPAFAALFALSGSTDLPEYTTVSDAPSVYDFDNNVAYLDAKLSEDWFDLRLLGSAQRIETLAYNDFDATSLPLVSFDTRGAFASVQTGELQLISNQTSWGSSWLKYIGGLYYLHSNAGFDPAVLQAGFYDATSLPVVGPLLGPLVQNLIDLAGPILPTPVDPISIGVSGLLRTNAGAAFFQATGKATDWLSLTIGGRYQKEKRGLYKSTVGLIGIDRPLISYPEQATTTSNFSPKVSLDIVPFEDALIYTSWSKGFKSGTYNIVSIYLPPDYVRPETVTSTELGIKSEFLDHSLRFNAALFNNIIRNLQVQIISLASGGAVAFENAPRARTRGAEFDMVWQPLPEALPGLVGTANGTYLQTKYTSFENGSGYDETTGIYFGRRSLLLLPARDFTGNRIPQSAKLTGDVGLGYTFNLGEGNLEIAGDVYYNSGLFYTAQNSDRSRQGSYYLTNARISYFYTPWNLRVTGYGKNINNARYFLFNYETDFGTNGLLQQPATYGVRLSWTFGK